MWLKCLELKNVTICIDDYGYNEYQLFIVHYIFLYTKVIIMFKYNY
jgi:hypothetical protein